MLLREDMYKMIVPIHAAAVNESTGQPINPEDLVGLHYLEAYRKKGIEARVHDWHEHVDEMIDIAREQYEMNAASLEVIDKGKGLVRVTQRAFDGSMTIHDYYLRLIDFSRPEVRNELDGSGE